MYCMDLSDDKNSLQVKYIDILDKVQKCLTWKRFSVFLIYWIKWVKNKWIFPNIRVFPSLYRKSVTCDFMDILQTTHHVKIIIH